MGGDRPVTYALVLATILLATLLDIYPLEFEHQIFRPQFVLLVAIYWIYVLPQSTSMTLLLILGLLQDVIVGTPLGQHPLMLTLVGYLCLRSYRRMRHFARWQEALWVFVLVVLAQLVAYWVQSLAGREFAGLEFMMPALASASVWPMLALILDAVRRRYRISRQI
ncbi:rod shape-determining protein MreD [Gilvimarinus algae]|uniref:Rod shape-determining protein MreD n=1 Tax=Gilvimarinus algae TaxID=3058037 RepID=A0ABT8TFI4_9GAMM|nr:rod shape-determining protein MreD [Gilvimarinus sp. SDUM040014]MDO3382844.1 rod shape-determining protein MreD [Gilvimarinus sp. SDUM040014]